MIVVAIIGLGSLGRYHLTGILKSKKDVHIYIVDPNEKALTESKKYLEKESIVKIKK